jgi:hypothetical protein
VVNQEPEGCAASGQRSVFCAWGACEPFSDSTAKSFTNTSELAKRTSAAAANASSSWPSNPPTQNVSWIRFPAYNRGKPRLPTTLQVRGPLGAVQRQIQLRGFMN